MKKNTSQRLNVRLPGHAYPNLTKAQRKKARRIFERHLDLCERQWKQNQKVVCRAKRG